MNRKTVAREWLRLVGLSGLGLGILLVVGLIGGVEGLFSEVIDILFIDVRWWAWGIVMGPYLLVQFSRSLMWAIRVIRK